MIAKLKESDHNFWKNKYDAAGRESSPIEILVFGSLMILTRNVTLDDLYEQTFISAEVHRCFFMVQYPSISGSCQNAINKRIGLHRC